MKTMPEVPTQQPTAPPPRDPRHAHRGLSTLFGVMLILVAVLALITALIGGGDVPSKTDAELKLTPKAELPVIEAREAVNWTHAPNVPPRIDRNGQARLVVNWRATEFVGDLDAANNVRYSYWGFEGSVPGPILRARVGDLVEVHLTNAAGNTHPHNIDFHFATGPGGGASALNVSPGETAIVEVRALAPGIYMYHCATPDIPTHIANGMYGFVIVEPEEGLPPVDHELYVVQSEFYTAPGGKAAPLTLDVKKLDLEEPDYVVFNGATGSLMGDSAPQVKVGDRVRIWFGNAGPQLISSFHVIGEIFDRVYREGDLVSPPARGVQTTLVPAGGATAVELTVDVPGTYLLVDHAIARTVHKGALGSIMAEGAANPEVFAPGADNPPPAGDDGHGGEPAGQPVTITQGAWDQANAEHAYDPAVIRVKAGTTVTWTNGDEVAHTVTADDGSFDSGFLNAGQSWSHTFTEPGTYAYHCIPHPWMKGTVFVS
ncbi:MAG: copper-containing nitrite reductase [Actinomycetota bacterium]